MADFNQSPLGQATTTLAPATGFTAGTVTPYLSVTVYEFTAESAETTSIGQTTTYYLGDLLDVIITDPQLDDRLVYDGSVWRNEAV